MKKVVLALMLLAVNSMAIEVGKVPTVVTISGDNGGKLSGEPWSSSSLKGKVHIVFYVDPDKKDLNDPFANALKKKHFSRSKYASVAIINLAATWIPNVAIEAKLKKKQKDFPDTLYVKDKNKVLVKKWSLADDNSDVLIFNKKGELIYKKFGKFSKNEIEKAVKLVESNL